MADQPFTITSTYTPGTDSLTCDTSSVTVGQGNTGKVTVKLQLASGSTGTIVFQSSPVNWTNGQPPNSTIAPPNGGTSQITVTVPNGNTGPTAESYPFTLNVTYTPPGGGSSVDKTGDPTIILEGTGGKAKGKGKGLDRR